MVFLKLIVFRDYCVNLVLKYRGSTVYMVDIVDRVLRVF